MKPPIERNAPAAPVVGDEAPDFTLPDAATGEAIHLAEFRGRDVLLVFFRGTWCPFCRAQMRVLTENYDALSRAGIQVLGVVCQRRASVARYLRASPLPFPLLADEGRAVAKSYAVHYWLSAEGFNLAKPAMFVLNRDGRITFRHVGANMRDLPLTTVLERFVGLLGQGSSSVASA